MAAPPLSMPPAEAFAPLLTQSLNGFAVLDDAGRYVYVSESMCRLLELDKAAMLGHVAADLIYEDDRPALAALLAGARAAAASECPSESFVRVRHARAGGAWHPVELKACTDGTYMFCVLLDAQLPARLESVLPEFLLSTSHDLRTPAASLQTAAHLLAAMPAVAADGEAVALLRTVDAACSMLLRTVCNVLLLRQLQRDGQLPPPPPPRQLNLRAAVARAVDTVHALNNVPPRLQWASQPRPPLPDIAYGDPDALGGLLLNVVLTAMRMAAWLAKPVRLHIEALRRAQAAAAALRLQQVHARVAAGGRPEAAEASGGGLSGERSSPSWCSRVSLVRRKPGEVAAGKACVLSPCYEGLDHCFPSHTWVRAEGLPPTHPGGFLREGFQGGGDELGGGGGAGWRR